MPPLRAALSQPSSESYIHNVRDAFIGVFSRTGSLRCEGLCALSRQDPDLDEVDDSLCGPLEFMCCTASACCTNAYVPEKAPESTETAAAPADFKTFHTMLSGVVKEKLAAVPVLTTSATTVLQAIAPADAAAAQAASAPAMEVQATVVVEADAVAVVQADNAAAPAPAAPVVDAASAAFAFAAAPAVAVATAPVSAVLPVAAAAAVPVAVAVPVAPAPPPVMMVQVPPGMVAGSMMQVAMTGGQLMQFPVPAYLCPGGGMMQVALPQ